MQEPSAELIHNNNNNNEEKAIKAPIKPARRLGKLMRTLTDYQLPVSDIERPRGNNSILKKHNSVPNDCCLYDITGQTSVYRFPWQRDAATQIRPDEEPFRRTQRSSSSNAMWVYYPNPPVLLSRPSGVTVPPLRCYCLAHPVLLSRPSGVTVPPFRCYCPAPLVLLSATLVPWRKSLGCSLHTPSSNSFDADFPLWPSHRVILYGPSHRVILYGPSAGGNSIKNFLMTAIFKFGIACMTGCSACHQVLSSMRVWDKHWAGQTPSHQ